MPSKRAAIDDDVAVMDANAELHLVACACRAIAPRHLALNLRCAESRFNDAAKLGQDAVAHQLDDPAAVFGNRRLDELRTLHLQCGERARFVLAHHAAVADDIRREDGSSRRSTRASAMTVAPDAMGFLTSLWWMVECVYQGAKDCGEHGGSNL
jgi:hypothetical protein